MAGLVSAGTFFKKPIIGDPVTPEEINSYRQRKEIDDRSFKLREVTSSWSTQQQEERKLRISFAWFLLIGLFSQILIMDFCFFFNWT